MDFYVSSYVVLVVEIIECLMDEGDIVLYNY